jgi:exopolysaccharide biosynthesis polyprenyl glycosylphosphotransferase
MVLTQGGDVMKNEQKYYYRFACSLVLSIISIGFFFFVWFRFVRVNNQTMHLLGIGNLGMAMLIYGLLYCFIALKLRAFKIGVYRKVKIISSQVITLFLVDAAELLVSMAITGQFRFFGRFLWRYTLLFIAQSVVISLVTILMNDLYRKIFPPFQVLEIYGDNQNDLTRKINSVEYKYHIVEKVHYKVEHLNEKIQLFDAILINAVPTFERDQILEYCFEVGKRVYFVPIIPDIIVKSSSELNLFDTPLYLCRNSGISKTEAIVKRVFDIIISSLAFFAFSPIFLITALAIKLNDGGPVFYKQERCTINGKKFMIIKFRSMIVDAEKDGKSHPAGEDDDRITKVGRIIRAMRIDELPQLFNILKGEMSVVGPRPERVEHVLKYTKDLPEFSFRSKVKGGLTGYAQVYGKYNTTALDKLKLDLIYIMNYSLLLDLQIIIETIKVLFQKDSTEGFTEERAAEIHDAVFVEKERKIG